jgi:putative ABC transport system substrate-binding protein
MRRRDFIIACGGVAAAPLAAHAQQRPRTRRIFVMMSDGPADSEMQHRIKAFRNGLVEAGWTENQNLQIDYRWYSSDAGRANAYAAEIVGMSPDLIVVGTRAAANAVMKANRTIPMLFVNLADPLGSGLVTNIARPDGLVTGFSAFEPDITGKWLTLLKEIAPHVSRVLFISGPNTGPYIQNFVETLRQAAAARSVFVTASELRDRPEIELAISSFAKDPNGGLLVAPDANMTTYHKDFVALAAAHRLPAVFPFRFVATAGGLASYGLDLADQYRQAAGMPTDCSEARSRPIFQFRPRRNSSLSSTRKLQDRWGSISRRR